MVFARYLLGVPKTKSSGDFGTAAHGLCFDLTR